MANKIKKWFIEILELGINFAKKTNCRCYIWIKKVWIFKKIGIMSFLTKEKSFYTWVLVKDRLSS